jgi:hypothetical protein
LVESDVEYDEITDIVELLTETILMCNKYKNNEVLDSSAVYSITTCVYNARKEYERLFSSKGWVI